VLGWGGPLAAASAEAAVIGRRREIVLDAVMRRGVAVTHDIRQCERSPMSAAESEPDHAEADSRVAERSPGPGGDRDEAIARLHELLLRAARFEVARRQGPVTRALVPPGRSFSATSASGCNPGRTGRPGPRSLSVGLTGGQSSLIGPLHLLLPQPHGFKSCGAIKAELHSRDAPPAELERPGDWKVKGGAA
jgi:hypothetical protein